MCFEPTPSNMHSATQHTSCEYKLVSTPISTYDSHTITSIAMSKQLVFYVAGVVCLIDLSHASCSFGRLTRYRGKRKHIVAAPTRSMLLTRTPIGVFFLDIIGYQVHVFGIPSLEQATRHSRWRLSTWWCSPTAAIPEHSTEAANRPGPPPIHLETRARRRRHFQESNTRPIIPRNMMLFPPILCYSRLKIRVKAY